MSNPYYDPEDFGLELVVRHDLSEPDYSFDILAVWRDDHGRFYLGTDSGCSCPTPFENYAGIRDMTGPLTAAQAVVESRDLKAVSYDPNYDMQGFNEFLAKIGG